MPYASAIRDPDTGRSDKANSAAHSSCGGNAEWGRPRQRFAEASLPGSSPPPGRPRKRGGHPAQVSPVKSASRRLRIKLSHELSQPRRRNLMSMQSTIAIALLLGFAQAFAHGQTFQGSWTVELVPKPISDAVRFRSTSSTRILGTNWGIVRDRSVKPFIF